jgi:dTMP kinase
MTQGKLIVFEGVDGSGTTTQVAKLNQKLMALKMASLQTAQPSGRPTGKLIREILGGKKIENPSFQTMSLLFAADRQDQQDNEILPALQKGSHVICDRYLHSSVIYQSVSADDKESQAWIKEINKHIIAPDLIFYLQIDADTAKARRTSRGGDEEIFDKYEFQKKLIAEYNRINEIFPSDNIQIIDATQTVEEIQAQVWSKATSILGLN